MLAPEPLRDRARRRVGRTGEDLVGDLGRDHDLRAVDLEQVEATNLGEHNQG
jgi:hypothetical protein